MVVVGRCTREKIKVRIPKVLFFSVLLLFFVCREKYPITTYIEIFYFVPSPRDEVKWTNEAPQQSGVKASDIQVLNLFDPPRTRSLTFNNIIIVHNSPLTNPHICRALLFHYSFQPVSFNMNFIMIIVSPSPMMMLSFYGILFFLFLRARIRCPFLMDTPKMSQSRRSYLQS